MIAGTHVIGASLIALLVDRMVLERRLGTTPFSTPSTKLSVTLGSALPVFIVITLSSAIACALVQYAAKPLGAAYLQSVLFAASIVMTGIASELLIYKRQSQELRNRMLGRTTVTAAILGFLVLFPPGNPGAADAISCVKGTIDAVMAGTVFVTMTLLWNGIMEKIELGSTVKRPLSPAQELVAACLLALVLQSISGLQIFHR